MQNVSQKQTQKVNSLEVMCRYMALQNPRALMQVMYQNGFLPIDAKREQVQEYLVKNAISLVREEGDKGIVKLLSVHPDKDLILEIFTKPVDKILPAPLESFTGNDKFPAAHAQNLAPHYPQPLAEVIEADNGAPLAFLLFILLIIIAIW